MIGRMQIAQGRVALVTGSSRGLGRAIARRLARDGLAVAVNGLRGDGQAAEVARTIRGEGGTADAFTADVTDEQQVTALAAAIAASLGPVDVLVLNATGPQPEAPLAEVAWEDHVAQLEFFVKSPVLLGRAVLPGMRARRSGRIIGIDSEVADRPPPGRSAYATAKNAQIGLARSWARELAPLRHHRQYGGAGLHPRRAARRRRAGDQERLPRLRAGWPDGNSRGHRLRGELLRLRGSGLHHRPAHRRRRRARPGPLTAGTPGDPRLGWRGR